MFVYVFRVPHRCQIEGLLSALFRCYRFVAVAKARHALAAPLKPYTAVCKKAGLVNAKVGAHGTRWGARCHLTWSANVNHMTH